MSAGYEPCNLELRHVSSLRRIKGVIELSTKVLKASVRETIVQIPTYGVGKPDKNPMFLEKEYIRAAPAACIRILSSIRSKIRRKFRSTG